MKKVSLLFAVLGIVLLAGCKSEVDCPENPFSTLNQVRFNSSIGEMSGTRASGTTWDQGDAIGVYALNAGQTLSDQAIYDGKANIKHTTPGDGIFAAATEGITFPESGNLDFVAYYPYQATISGYAYPVNVANQSNLAAIDVLYSDDAKGANKSNAVVPMTFKHMLSQLVLNISAGDGVASLTGLSATVEGLIADGSMNLVNGAVTTGTTASTLSPAATVSGTSATITAIIVPGQDLNTAKVSFMLNGKVYEWTPAAQTLESGKRYSYMLKLSATDVVTVQPQATITDWVEGYTGISDIILTPNQDPQFAADKTTVSLPATGTLTDVVKLITQADQEWTATSSEDWLTVSDASGTGPKDITLTAQENTTTAERTATVTITPTGSTSFDPVVVNVTQAAGSATPEQPTTALLFPGSDFEDWTAFTNSLNSYGLKNYASQSDNGRNGSKAFYINGTPEGNDYVFTTTVKEGYSVAGKTKIVFYIKGTSAKSLSINLYKANGTNYHVYNLETYSQEATLVPANENAQTTNGTNSYTGTINTGEDWMKVTLDLSSIAADISSEIGKNLFALKVGKDAAYDLLVDDITLE